MLKSIIIISLTAVVSFWHIHGSRTALESHLLHQQLFFIPIILAGFWFRLRSGIILAVIVSIIYLTSMQFHMNNPGIAASVYLQIFLYVFIAALLGWLTSRLDKQQLQAIKDEKGRAITKLASALSYEIYEIAHSLETKYHGKHGLQDYSINRDFDVEIQKLQQLTKAFEQFEPPDGQDLLSSDLNEIVKSTQHKYQVLSRKTQVSITVELDEAGCPSMVLNDNIIRILEALLENAIEASHRGAEVIIRSTRKGSHCLLEVIDFGDGVHKENRQKLFKPFFTTKTHGHGLSLAAGKKIIKDYGGDLTYAPGINGGSIFTLIVPRENINKNIDGHISEKMGR